MSVRPSVILAEQNRATLTGRVFVKFNLQGLYEVCWHMPISVKIRPKNRNLTKRPAYGYNNMLPLLIFTTDSVPCEVRAKTKEKVTIQR